MGNVNLLEKEILREHIMHCQVSGLNTLEIQTYLKLKGIHISIRRIQRYKAKIRDEAEYWIDTLAKSKKKEYVAQYKDRTEEVRQYEIELWKIIKDEKTTPDQSMR